MEKKVYLSSTDKKIAGVCGGLAEYFNIDASLIRIIWAVAVLCGGCGLLAYVLCWLIFPKRG